MVSFIQVIVLLGMFALGTKESLASDAGITAIIGNRGMQYVSQLAKELIVQKVGIIDVPDIDETASHFKIQVSSFHCSNLQIGGLSIQFAEGGSNNGDVQVLMNDISITCGGHYHYKLQVFPKIPRGHGNIDLTVGRTALIATTRVAVAQDGHPQISLVPGTCQVNADITKLHFSHGGLNAKILNLFKGKIKSALEKTLNKKLCGIISELLTNKLDPILKTYKQKVKLPLPEPLNHAVIDYSLVSGNTSPSGSEAYVGVKALFYGDSDIGVPPAYTACPLPQTLDYEGRMGGIVICPALFESAGWTLLKQNVLHAKVTHTDLPPSVPFKLNTATFKKMIPSLYESYPDLNMQLEVLVVENTELSIKSENKVQLATVLDINWDVETLDGGIENAFTLTCPINVDVVVGLEQDVTQNHELSITGQLKEVNCVAKLKNSNVGEITDINIKNLNSLVKAAIKLAVLPQVNKLMAKGIPLPTLPYVTFQNTSLKAHDGYLLVASDVTYTDNVSLNNSDEEGVLVVVPNGQIQILLHVLKKVFGNRFG